MVRIPLCDLERAVDEQQALAGLRVDNVYQCDQRVFLLKLTPGKVFLLLDLTPGRARALVTDEPPAVPDKPPVFGAILRNALRGGRLAGASLPARDRIVALEVDGYKVMVEALPRHPNLLLVDEKGVVERVLNGDAARHRGNPVGAVYTLPKPPKVGDEESLLPDDLPDGPFAANHALDRLCRGAGRREQTEQDERAREKILARLKKTRGAVAGDLKKLADPARLRQQGEALLTHYGELRQGMKSFRGTSLDPKLSPQENIDNVFQRARKAERGRPMLEARLAELDALIARVESGEHVPVRELPGRIGKKPPPRRAYRVFRSAEGARILVGKGGRDNDETTMKVAGPHDVFLHVRGSPGAHVIVPLKRGEQMNQETLLDAASLALHYSKMRTATAADVSYTPRKHVSKPKGAKPGLVMVRREKVLRLRREPDRIARLLMTAE